MNEELIVWDELYIDYLITANFPMNLSFSSSTTKIYNPGATS